MALPSTGFIVAYLDPPPFPAPVIVQKDVGGVVADYQARTEQYRREGREVRLHECRSACTLALSLPNVCVYPSSLLKFHKAYDWNTKVRDEGVSAQLMESYPRAIQVRLGSLTRDYQALTGAELIAMGLRNCNEGAAQMARVKPSAEPPKAPGVLGTILAALTPDSAGAKPAPQATARTAAPQRELDTPPQEEAAPLPPRRPGEFAAIVTASLASEPAPLPPRRPAEFAAMPGLPKIIAGAQPVLPYGVLSYSAFGR